MAVNHGLLNRMQFTVCRQSFDGDNLACIYLMHKDDATIHGQVLNSIVINSANEHSASAAVTFCADHLRSAEVPLLAQVLGHREKRSVAVNDL